MPGAFISGIDPRDESLAREVKEQDLGRMLKHTRAIRSILLFAMVLVLASLLLAAWPATLARPLITKTDWAVSGQAFPNGVPQRFELSKSMSESKQAIYWRTWSPSTAATRASIVTSPFRPSHYMAIPYGGFAGEPDIRLDLRCVRSGAIMPIATARTNVQMTAAMIRVPESWCPGDAVLHAESQSVSKYIEVGTPFKISWIDYYKNSFVGLVGIYVLVFLFSWGLLFLPTAIGILRSKSNFSLVMGVAVFGVVGYVMFFVFFFSSTAGRVVSACLFAFEILLMSWLYIYRKNELEDAWCHWKVPTVLWAIVSFTAFLLALATHNGAGPWTVNALFKPVQWSSDNQLPMQISEYLFHGLDPRTLNLGPWKVSDRPPLAYGLMAMFRLLSWGIVNHNDGASLYFQYEQIGGIVINGLWIVALYYLLAELKLSVRQICAVLLVVGLTGFAIFNSVFIWPKMLGAAFGLIAFTLLLAPSESMEPRAGCPFGPTLLWAALLSGLAIMSHGGTAFGVVASILVALWYRGLPSPRLAAGAVLIGLAVLVPWGLWQHFEQPPGNALVKYAFSGSFGFAHPDQSILSAVSDAYSHLTLPSWAEMKLHALRILVTGEGSQCGIQEMDPVQSLYGRLRVQDFFYLGPSLRFLAIGFLPLIFQRRSRLSEQGNRRLLYARIMVATGLLSVGLYTLAGFHCYINHMQSYQAILEVLAGLVLALKGTNRWYFNLCLVLSVVYGLIVWLVDPLASAAYSYMLPIAFLCGLGIWVYWFFSRKLTKEVLANTSSGTTASKGKV